VKRDVAFEAPPPAQAYLLDKGFNIKFGAQPLRRIIRHEIKTLLALDILKGRFAGGANVIIDLAEGRIVFHEGAAAPERELVGASTNFGTTL
jgi:ATP-dependent Clp protease ATP-binding subunit ClpA